MDRIDELMKDLEKEGQFCEHDLEGCKTFFRVVGGAINMYGHSHVPTDVRGVDLMLDLPREEQQTLVKQMNLAELAGLAHGLSTFDGAQDFTHSVWLAAVAVMGEDCPVCFRAGSSSPDAEATNN